MNKLSMHYRKPVLNDFDEMIAVSKTSDSFPIPHERFRYRESEASVDSPKFRGDYPELFLD